MSNTNLTKKELAESLKRLASERLFEHITVGDIVKECGVNRQTFYYHFTDKYELLDWIYNLNLDGDQWKALERLESTEYCVVNDLIDIWEDNHPEVKIGFNGRSAGYIVLYRDKGFSDVLPECIADYDYEEFKEYCRYCCGSVKNYMSELRYYTQLVRDFDQLCDDLRDYVNEISKIPDEEWES